MAVLNNQMVGVAFYPVPDQQIPPAQVVSAQRLKQDAVIPPFQKGVGRWFSVNVLWILWIFYEFYEVSMNSMIFQFFLVISPVKLVCFQGLC